MNMKKILVFASMCLLAGCSQKETFDANALIKDVKENYYDETMVEVDSSLAKNLLFLEDEATSCVGLTSSNQVVSEIMICQGSNESNDKLTQRIAYYKDSAERYTPEDVTMIEESQLFDFKDATILIIGDNAAEVKDYIQKNY